MDRSKPQRGVTDRQAGLLRDNAKEAAERRARIEALNDRRREQAVHLQGVADDARAVAAMVEHTLHDVAAKRDELQAAASSHDEELKAPAAQQPDRAQGHRSDRA